MLYLYCSCLNLSLRIFLIFWNFSSIFRAFKIISRFYGIVFALKINSKKNKSYPFGLGRARRPDPSWSASAQPQARASPSGPDSQGWPGLSRHPSACVPHTPRRLPCLIKVHDDPRARPLFLPPPRALTPPDQATGSCAAGEHPHVVPHTSSTPSAARIGPSSSDCRRFEPPVPLSVGVQRRKKIPSVMQIDLCPSW
jgi:hypothetical protein